MAARNLPEMRSPTTGKPFAVRRSDGPHWTGAVELIPEKLDEPLHWRKSRRVFVNSMSDLFHEALSDVAIDRVFAVMMASYWNTFQVLTKRPERMLKYLSQTRGNDNVLSRVLAAAKALPFPRGYVHADGFGWPYRNIWLGVSVEDQATADARIPILLQMPAAKRFISYEPALEEVNLRLGRDCLDTWSAAPPIDWVIVGGESGPGARSFDVAWARSAVRQCREEGVACFVKQLGAKPTSDHRDRLDGEPAFWTALLRDPKGGDMAEWSEDLRVREFPE